MRPTQETVEAIVREANRPGLEAMEAIMSEVHRPAREAAAAVIASAMPRIDYGDVRQAVAGDQKARLPE